MTGPAVKAVLLYMMFAFGLGVFVGSVIKWGRGEDHERPR